MEAFIIDGIRTPIGSFGGTLSPIRTADLGAHVIKELMSRKVLKEIRRVQTDGQKQVTP